MNVQGPDFVALQWRDKEAGATFYETMLGLKRAGFSPPDAVVFDTQPIAFAIREPLVDLDLTEHRGLGVVLWLLADDSASVLDHMRTEGADIVRPLAESPFGKTFTFRDPEGYLVTIHDKG